MRKIGFVVVSEILTRDKRFVRLSKDARWLLAYYYLNGTNLSHAGFLIEGIADIAHYPNGTAVIRSAQTNIGSGVVRVRIRPRKGSCFASAENT